ncbi:MAG TPA: PQQ-binding-like beta-propeller repeat protein, partial [Sphingomonadaceae bacterium]|nr:PQQ-binding-like beta-propeller repeat protein [Sphingomonadaceae bacterium]
MHKRIALALGAAVLALPAFAQTSVTNPDPGDWPLYARDASGTRFAPMDDINRGNVASLEQAWSLALRPEGGGALLGGTVPIVIDGIMYVPTGTAVLALEGDSGEVIWRHEITGGLARRAVSYWPGDGEHSARIYYSTGSALHAISLATGEPDPGFGTGGSIAIEGTPYNYPPSIYKNVMVIGANTQEDPRGESGNTRAFDARTGAKLWEFNVVPRPGEVGHETWLDDGWKDRSGTNMWVWYTTYDPETNLLYHTLGSPSPNYYGGDRPGDNLFGNSIVALDLDSGEYRWHFQTIHHELWDWDLPAPPVLFDLTIDGKTVPALAETGKPGLMYILNRKTGEPIHGVNEHFVAAANVPGEWYSPTQPIPVKPKPLSNMYWDPSDVVTAEITNEEHAQACRDLLDSYGGTFFNSGPFTPFFLLDPKTDPPRASINRPHNGGVVWGGSAADPGRGIVYVNTSEGGSIGWIEERDPEGDYGRGTATSNQKYDRGSLIGPGAYSGFMASFEDEEGNSVTLPCFKPPWGRLYAVDANSGEIKWEKLLGLSEALGEDKQNT